MCVLDFVCVWGWCGVRLVVLYLAQTVLSLSLHASKSTSDASVETGMNAVLQQAGPPGIVGDVALQVSRLTGAIPSKPSWARVLACFCG